MHIMMTNAEICFPENVVYLLCLCVYSDAVHFNMTVKSMSPFQTAPKEAIWSGSIVFAM